MMKGRTTNNIHSNRSLENGKRDSKPKKTSNVKTTSEQERPKAIDIKEALVVLNDKATQSKLSKAHNIVNGNNDDDGANESLDTYQESMSSEITEEIEKEDALNGPDDSAKDHDDDDDDDDEEETESKELEEEEAMKQKVEILETRIQKLEEELREVAALEISLYSILPDHCSSSHKLHTPARRTSRLYIHACKHWSQGKRVNVARNIVSGLILVAKSCGNDVSRLTFWLSNIVALREIISCHYAKAYESNGSEQSGSRKQRSKNNQSNGYMEVFEEWHEPETFLSSLEKVEFWVFSRVIESVWWQVFIPHMQSPENVDKTNEKLTEPVSGNHEKGSVSISLWKNAFKVSLSRLCPMRGSGHECGCLPILSKMVMEKCITRVDVAMFNAILRESEHHIPTDPVSDPILDSNVLPITSGDLSFGSGARLKNTIGNWSRCLDEMFDINARDSSDYCIESEDGESKYFTLLNELSDLLMLPKDLLVDRSIREEVSPSISLEMIKRILCNFTPDEFCPDHVPGSVLEELNNNEVTYSNHNFIIILYVLKSSVSVANEVLEVRGDTITKFFRNVSMIQRKGYTSDEELEELDSPISSIIDKVSVSLISTHDEKVKQEGEDTSTLVTNSRYELLKEVWSM
ncbi:unnamed protein product [Cochlearia groenlandica]